MRSPRSFARARLSALALAAAVCLAGAPSPRAEPPDPTSVEPAPPDAEPAPAAMDSAPTPVDLIRAPHEVAPRVPRAIDPVEPPVPAEISEPEEPVETPQPIEIPEQVPPPPEPIAPAAEPPPTPAEPAPAVAPATGMSPAADPCLQILGLAIKKSERKLTATCASGATHSFRVALGQLPLGYKRQQHDLRTPEGYYRIAEAPRGSRFHVFMLLNYPSLADADRALSDGYIGPRTYLRIARAFARGELPPQDTLLGGMVGIHGEGSDHQGDSSRLDWTFGCIALTDADAEFIAFRVDVGTPVSIEP